ncbi:DUF6460 domain-containing protein [Yunchengibacter salinarum]|uniref:DUF6460 domain-containing protein n=1 Tax=Yunchengibacter salinarum TaxID=3133399 RepID=UPI0035B5BABC
MTRVDLKTVLKLALLSLIVGAILYALGLSPGDIYGWAANVLADIWHWLVTSGLQYMALGAAIVVPIFLILRLKKGIR